MPGRSIQLSVKPDLLSWARMSVGLEADSAARKIKVPDEVLRNWESGVARPTLVQAEKLANLYKRPLAAFFLPRPPREPALPQDFRTLPSGSPGPLSYETRIAIRRAWRLQSLTTELTEGLGRRLQPGLDGIRRSDDPERLAASVRAALKVPLEDQFKWHNYHEALRRWRRSLELLGVSVFQFSMPLEDTRGFSLPSAKAPAIVLNTRDWIGARSFSLFHELAHLLLDRGGICGVELWERGADAGIVSIETYCNHFAGAFLVPRTALLEHRIVIEVRRARRWSDEELQGLVLDFKVSQEVILRRLLMFGLATQAFYETKREEWAKAARSRSKKKSHGAQSPAKKCVNENGVPFVSLVLDSFNRDRITYADVSNYLGVRIKHIDKIAELSASGG
jgi:Zn-dependent peptidase ImmA (M78 family)